MMLSPSEKKAAKRRSHRLSHLEEVREADRLYYHKNRDRIRAQMMDNECPGCGKAISRRARHCQSCFQTGDKASNWKGGRQVLASGYVRIHVPGHPRALKRTIFEHIVVMEKHLGRYLLPGENVHHKNLIRNDNRIENLELWVTGQPSGARVEDLLAWAHEIINRYE